MPETAQQQVVDLDPKDFKLNSYDNIHIIMPVKPSLTQEDIDAQLFEYVLSSGKEINSIADLDDTWVQSNFEGMETIEDVKQSIQDQYDHDMEWEYSDLKFKTCCDALLDRLEGDVDEELLAHNIEAMRAANLARLEEMHISTEQFLREEHLTADQYEDRLRDETLYQMRLNVALDIEAGILNMQVGNHEICDYLATPDPEKFLEEIRENDQVEEARRAAVRVKVMRRIVDTAVVKEEGAGEQPEPESEPEDDDFELPDFVNMPAATISGDTDGEELHVVNTRADEEQDVPRNMGSMME